MHRFIVVCFVLLALVTLAPAQGWQWLNPLPQGNTLTDIEYLGANHLFATGYNGTAVGSADDGLTWTLRNNGEHAFPSEVDFVNSMEGWGIRGPYSPHYGDGMDNAILYTSDGGYTWQHRFDNPDIQLDGLSFPTAQNGWVVGTDLTNYNLAVLHTTDGGATWNQRYSNSLVWTPARVYFVNEQVGWIAHESGINHTTDGGTTWQTYPSAHWFYYVLQFVDNQVGWGAAFDSLYRTTDAGQTWAAMTFPVPNPGSVISVATRDTDHVWALDHAGRVYRSTNGGQFWSWALVDPNAALRDITFADNLHGWVSGSSGLIYETADGGITWTRRTTDMMADESFGLSAIDFVDLQNGWMTGRDWQGSAPILHTTDGGVNWNVQYWDTCNSFSDIKAVSLTDIWVVGETVLHSTNGGQTWNNVDIGMSGYYTKVLCPDDQTVWIVVNWGGHVCRSTDGGISWDSHDGIEMNDAAASDANNFWLSIYHGCAACNDYPTITHTSDGGETWVTQMSDGSDIGALFFLDSLHGWASGWPGIYRTTDGGANWVASNDTIWGQYRLKFLDPLNGWATGYGTASRTTDGGMTWQSLDPCLEDMIGGMDFVDVDHGWITGSNAILRFDGSATGTPERPAAAPTHFALLPAYPNPFNAVTNLTFDLATAGRVRVEVFDLTGRLVKTLSDRAYESGRHSIRFDAGGWPSGLYFARLSTGDIRVTEKLILLR